MENGAASLPYNPNRRFRKSRRDINDIKLLTSQVAFRVVCHVSVVGGLIGKAGSIISSISAETDCGIHCQEVVPGSDHRVVLVVGSGSIDRKIVFSDNNGGEQFREVSSAQEAVVRVFERVWEVEAEIQGENEGDDVAYCGLLADKTHIGAVIGRGGRCVTRIRRETGAKIRMLPPPTCAAKDDELIQIMGGTLAVKKALIAVTSYLQDCPPVGKDLGLLSGPVEMVHHGDSPDPHRELFADLYSFLPPSTGNSVNSVSKFHSSSAYADRESSLDKKGTQKEIAFRLICSNNEAGGIIGRKGAIVRDLQNQSGALITFAAPLIGSSERVVTVSALENSDTLDSPAQNAVNIVFARSVEVSNQGFSSGMTNDTTVTAKLLVGSDLVRCLTANGDRVVSEIINKSGTDIQILGEEQVLDYASEDDLVVQITGKYKDVQNALFQVTGRLRQNLLSFDVLNEMEMRSCNGSVWETTPSGLHQSLPPSPESKKETVSTRVVHQFELSKNKDGPASTKSYQPQNKGRGHTTDTINGEQNSRTLGRGSKIVKSLDYLMPTEVLNEMRSRSPSGGGETTSTGLHKSLGHCLDSGEHNILLKSVAQLGLSDNMGGPPKLQASKAKRRGHTTAITDGDIVSTTFAGASELQSGKKPVFVANTTVEIVVAGNVFGCVYGKDGSNLAHLKQISGAKIKVCDPRPGKSEGVVVISGTPDQTLVAQSLLQAFIQSGE
ncbi:hypothetical protein ACOSP7_023485 [Xanthoceras sorbifolium]